MNVAGASATGLAGSAPRSNALTWTVRSGLATGTFWLSRNENSSRVEPQVMVPAGLMICGKTVGCCRLTSQPSGVPDGVGVTGQPAAPPPEAEALGPAVAVEPPPDELQAATSRSEPSTASVRSRVIAEA